MIACLTILGYILFHLPLRNRINQISKGHFKKVNKPVKWFAFELECNYALQP